MVIIQTKSTIRQHYHGGVSTNSRNDATYVSYRPPLTKGQWIDFGNNNRFRLPTDYGVSEVTFERGSPMISEGYRPVGSEKWDYGRSTGNGGYYLDNFTSGNWLFSFSSTLGIPSLIQPPALITEERNEAVTKCLNKIGDQKLNLGENIATLGQTARMIVPLLHGYVNLTRAYTNVVRHLPSGFDWRRIARMSYRDLVRGKVGTAFASKYLEYVYGFKPLMEDIFSAMELAKESGMKPLLLNAKASAKRYRGSPDRLFNNISQEQKENWTGTVSHSVTRCNIWAKLSDKYQLTRTLNQLGLVNPMDLIWELVPYSFVIDWVLPIGPVLTAYTAPAGLDFVGGAVSRRTRAYWDYSILDNSFGDWVIQSNSPATGKGRYDGYKRERLTSWPQPGLWFAPDPLGLTRDGSDRAIKALALTIARMPHL